MIIVHGSVRYLPFEVKETLGSGPPLLERFPWFIEYIVGIAYPVRPTYGAPNDAYLSAALATYFLRTEQGPYAGDWYPRRGFLPGAFLAWLSDRAGVEHLWPAEYDDAPIYEHPEWRPQSPLRELLRRHLHPSTYVSDLDLLIAEGATWPPRPS